jgi:hypothetical protein
MKVMLYTQSSKVSLLSMRFVSFYSSLSRPIDKYVTSRDYFGFSLTRDDLSASTRLFGCAASYHQARVNLVYRWVEMLELKHDLS